MSNGPTHTSPMRRQHGARTHVPSTRDMSLLLLLHGPAAATSGAGAVAVRRERTLVPWVLVTRVLPMERTWKAVGALMSYQSFLAKGSA